MKKKSEMDSNNRFTCSVDFLNLVYIYKFVSFNVE